MRNQIRGLCAIKTSCKFRNLNRPRKTTRFNIEGSVTSHGLYVAYDCLQRGMIQYTDVFSVSGILHAL